MASGGYPGSYKKGIPISGLDQAAKMKDVFVFRRELPQQTKVLLLTEAGAGCHCFGRHSGKSH
ncbi:MAG: hypothetical protein R2941_13245 [Desulfobacterales bacterium]